MNLLHRQNIKLVIFDFDGTIADTSIGILDAHCFALSAMGKAIPEDEELRDIIGWNLLNTYISRFGLDKLSARKAVEIYRERYAKIGIHKATLYPNFLEILKELKSRGYKIAIATLKAEAFAKIMVCELGIEKYFDKVCGMDVDDTLNKEQLVIKCCELCNTSKAQAVLIGDSTSDLIGATHSSVNFIGVTYGFGFKPNRKYNFTTVNDPIEILKVL